ncbi:MAG TPA: hypothetical protein DGG95_11145, partial [Cytophagales bacterium]|nr:hypothetical protein [Cytophagales bacterium]
MPRFYILFVLVIGSLTAKAQVAKEKIIRDSLAIVQNDHERIELLIKLAKIVGTRSTDSAMQIGMNASLIAKKTENEKDQA